MDLDPVILSRLQFAWVIAWHILLPAFTVGIASFIALLEGLKLVTGREVYVRISTFWIKIFSIAFGMGVVTGVVMPFQIGTNWSRYADATANVLSPLFAYEGLTAFFLEAAFLGVLLFGRKLVPPWAYFISALMVALGTLFSSFWILAANSWMQTPAGYEIVNGQFFSKDWFQVIFSPSFPYRLAHVVVGFFVTSWFRCARRRRLSRPATELCRRRANHVVDDAVAADRSRPASDDHRRSARPEHARPSTRKTRGHRSTLGYRASCAADSVRHSQAKRRRTTLSPSRFLCSAASSLTHDLDGEVKGLKDFPADQRPPVAIPFFAFRIMVGCAVLMLGIVLLGGWLRWRGRLYDAALFLRLAQFAAPLGFVAVIAGWCVTEVGRQPWTVYGLLRTAQSVSPSLTGHDVAISLAGYMLVYLLIYPWGLQLMLRIVRKGPGYSAEHASKIEAGRPEAPVLAGALGPAKGEIK